MSALSVHYAPFAPFASSTPFAPLEKLLTSVVCSASLLIFSMASATAQSQPTSHEPGALLRSGNWDGGVGTYLLPMALEKIDTAKWPTSGWVMIVHQNDRINMTPVIAPKSDKPEFLKKIVAQINAGESAASTVSNESATQSAIEADAYYLRVPGIKFKQSSVPTYRFRNGSSQLLPILDHRYSLTLGSKPFAFTVQNGLRNASGVAYGEGANYRIEYDGNTYEYNLGGYGWDSTIRAIADLDADGKPDFIIYIGGSNSGIDVVLLSSVAKPGKNPPTASLTAVGC
jgi:hypothetical protein